jgi:hypothetical protein
VTPELVAAEPLCFIACVIAPFFALGVDVLAKQEFLVQMNRGNVLLERGVFSEHLVAVSVTFTAVFVLTVVVGSDVLP